MIYSIVKMLFHMCIINTLQVTMIQKIMERQRELQSLMEPTYPFSLLEPKEFVLFTSIYPNN